MVTKEKCSHCRGNKVVEVKATSGAHKTIPCPHCGGNGYKVRVTL